ncbi:MAG: hypothetical protein LBS94_03180 [Prevotellaceae bacterium]|nr:hypothetical protein [Prevotellaceae bacterium]
MMKNQALCQHLYNSVYKYVVFDYCILLFYIKRFGENKLFAMGGAMRGDAAVPYTQTRHRHSERVQRVRSRSTRCELSATNIARLLFLWIASPFGFAMTTSGFRPSKNHPSFFSFACNNFFPTFTQIFHPKNTKKIIKK